MAKIDKQSHNDDNNSTFVESNNNLINNSTFIEDKIDIADPTPHSNSSEMILKSINLNGVNYTIIKQLEVASGEADLFIIENPSKQTLVLKYYRPMIEPKNEIHEILKSLPESSVIKLLETGKTSTGRFFEIQEYAKFGSLSEYLKINPSVPHSFIKEFCFKLNKCLSEIHSKNVIHRDIKPANILIKNIKPLEIVLTDFGISSVAELSMHQTSMSRTILYSSPESMTGIVSKASDYWALGLIALEMVLKKHPFSGVDDKTIMFILATKNVPCINEIDSEFTHLIKGLLTRDPLKRWGYMEVEKYCNADSQRDVNTIPIYFEDQNNNYQTSNSRKVRPYKFEGIEYYSLEDLLLPMAKNWNQAIIDFESNELRDWIVREIRDKDTQVLFEDLINDERLNINQKMFEFFCRSSINFPFIFKGVLISFEWLIDISLKIINNKANDHEKEVLTDLKDGFLIEKYYKINGNNNFLNEFKPILNDWRLASNNLDDLAKITLLNLSKEYKTNLVDKIKNEFKDCIIINPFEGLKTVDNSFGLICKIIQNNYNNFDLLIASNVTKNKLISKNEIEQKTDILIAYTNEIFENISNDDIIQIYNEHANIFSNNLSDVDLINELLEKYSQNELIPKLDYYYYSSLCKYQNLLDQLRESLNREIKTLYFKVYESSNKIQINKEIVDLLKSVKSYSLDYYLSLKWAEAVITDETNKVEAEKLHAQKVKQSKKNKSIVLSIALIIIVFITIFAINYCLDSIELKKYNIENEKMFAESSKTGKLTLNIGNNIKLEMVKIPSGKYTMGSFNDLYGRSDTIPVKEITISKKFYIGIYEVTQGQWNQIMGSNPSFYNKGSNYPVETVSWIDCQKFINRLNQLQLVNRVFRLPSEAEWEYACSAGSLNSYYWGDTMNDNFCWYSFNSIGSTHPVGKKKSNSFGLYDMSGNVMEWCNDWYDKNYYSTGPSVDPKGPVKGITKVIRGGGYNFNADSCCTAERNDYNPKSRYDYIGFRLVLNDNQQ
jgi:formylglycine-generating enzyme required for sulfatase activity/serine/threonine protein kinase